MTRLTRSMVVVAAMLLRASSVAAQAVSDAETMVAASVPLVRGADALAASIMAEGALHSPSVARLLNDLQRSDMIVTVVTGWLPVGISGLTRFVAAAGGVRHVRITLKIPHAARGLIATLGHELRHATEIAGMPEVRDEASLAAAYRRLGVAMRSGGFFETDAAVRTGEQVARELIRTPRN